MAAETDLLGRVAPLARGGRSLGANWDAGVRWKEVERSAGIRKEMKPKDEQMEEFKDP